VRARASRTGPAAEKRRRTAGSTIGDHRAKPVREEAACAAPGSGWNVAFPHSRPPSASANGAITSSSPRGRSPRGTPEASRRRGSPRRGRKALPRSASTSISRRYGLLQPGTEPAHSAASATGRSIASLEPREAAARDGRERSQGRRHPPFGIRRRIPTRTTRRTRSAYSPRELRARTRERPPDDRHGTVRGAVEEAASRARTPPAGAARSSRRSRRGGLLRRSPSVRQPGSRTTEGSPLPPTTLNSPMFDIMMPRRSQWRSGGFHAAAYGARQACVERNRSERAKIANVAGGEARASPERIVSARSSCRTWRNGSRGTEGLHDGVDLPVRVRGRSGRSAGAPTFRDRGGAHGSARNPVHERFRRGRREALSPDRRGRSGFPPTAPPLPRKRAPEGAGPAQKLLPRVSPKAEPERCESRRSRAGSAVE